MIASVHIADVGARSALGITRKAPPPGSIAGLRSAGVGLAAPLSKTVLPSVQFGRAALIAFWDDDAAIDRFLADHPLAAKFASGWHLRLDPLRAYGSWPGLPSSVPAQRKVDHQGPVAAITLGRLMPSQAIRFVRTSAKAEASVLQAQGMIWATGFARPPSFVATCSLWESTRALSTYAYGHGDPGHPDAIATSEAKPFHRQQAFIRFRPYGSSGKLDGKNPLAEAWMPAPESH
jgi:hypothetical protein